MNRMYVLAAVIGLSMATARTCWGYEEALTAALEGPEGAHAVIAKHRFEVQPPKMEEKTKRQYTLRGQLKRLDKTRAKDDVITYRIVRAEGAVKSIEVQVNGGMWLPIAEAVMTALGDYRNGGPMSEEKQKEVTRALEKLMDGSWQKAAEFLIAHIAARHC